MRLMATPPKRNNNSAPKVSVIIPAYRVAPFIRETLDSVLAQSFADYEIIIINDGSPDTAELETVLADYNDLIYVKQENRGAGAARNEGLRRASGELVAFLDGDDIWYPDFLSEQVRLLESNGGYDLVYADAMKFGDPEREGHTSMEESPSRGEVTFSSLLSGRCSVITSAVVARRQPIAAVGLFDENFPNSQDFDLWLRLIRDGGARMTYQRKSLVGRRIYPGSLAADPIKSFGGELRVLDKVAARSDLTPQERATLERTVVKRRATMAVIEGKRALVRGDFATASNQFAQANRCLHRFKLTLVLLGLKIAPRWLQRLEQRRTPESHLLYSR
jgi:glycosyltransferase involved in cell wall biosynthesis